MNIHLLIKKIELKYPRLYWLCGKGEEDNFWDEEGEEYCIPWEIFPHAMPLGLV
jgi:hypothetical protein